MPACLARLLSEANRGTIRSACDRSLLPPSKLKSLIMSTTSKAVFWPTIITVRSSSFPFYSRVCRVVLLELQFYPPLLGSRWLFSLSGHTADEFSRVQPHPNVPSQEEYCELPVCSELTHLV